MSIARHPIASGPVKQSTNNASQRSGSISRSNRGSSKSPCEKSSAKAHVNAMLGASRQLGDSQDALRRTIAALVEKNQMLEEETRMTKMKFYEYMEDETKKKKKYEQMEEQLRSADHTIEILFTLFDNLLSQCGLSCQKDLIIAARDTNLKRKQHAAHVLGALAACTVSRRTLPNRIEAGGIKLDKSAPSWGDLVNIQNSSIGHNGAHLPSRSEEVYGPLSGFGNGTQNGDLPRSMMYEQDRDSGSSYENGNDTNRSAATVMSTVSSSAPPSSRPIPTYVRTASKLPSKVPGLSLNSVGAGSWLAGEQTAGDTYLIPSGDAYQPKSSVENSA